MGHEHHLTSGHRFNFMIFSLLFLIVSSWTPQGLATEGRETLKYLGSDEQLVVSEEGTSVKSSIYSAPPDCTGKCGTCTHCVAVKVPIEPPVQKEKMNTPKSAYVRGDDYKPIRWVCRCGNLIFDP